MRRSGKALVLLVTSIMVVTKTTPKISSEKWDLLDCAFNDLAGPLHWMISNGEIPTDEAAEQLGRILSNLLEKEPDFQESETRPPVSDSGNSLEEARLLKKSLRKKARRKDASAEDKAEWLRAVKLHAFLLKKKKEREGRDRVRREEKFYRKDFYRFAKEACGGTLFEQKIQPAFGKEVADEYFNGKYGAPKVLDESKLDWMEAPPPPTTPYDRSAIRPCQIKRILKMKRPNSSPGEDGLLYGILYRLPSLHHILATLLTKMNESCLAPASWARSQVVLAHKGGEADDPSQFRMIALTSCLGKIYHQLKAERLAEYMVDNEYIDDGTQKAFLKAVNGCTEHVQVLSEIFQDAKQKRKTVHVSWYDLSDAYGSIPHQLIEYVLKLYHIPLEEIKYIRSLYSQLEGVVVTKKWRSNPFFFKNGIFTGDTLSPIVFNTTFQPLIDSIRRKKESSGYNLSNRKVITKPFADDFELITANQKVHQRIQDEIQQRAATMGLVFKPAKCRSLSICGGKPKPVVFYLTDPGSGERIPLKTLEEDPFKFLGSTITFLNNPADHLEVLKEKITKKLGNLDKTLVRGEYKLAVYSRYVLPSLRYHLTVHTVHKTHLDELDLIAQRYLKKWLGIPARGATAAGVFSPYLLNVKPVSQVYLEGHLGAFVNSTLMADEDTKQALANAMERERAWTKKSSTICECNNILEEMRVETNCTIPSPDNCANYRVTIRVEKPKIMAEAKRKVDELYRRRSEEKVAKLGFQGEMLKFLQEEEQDIPWKALLYRVPKGVLAWATRACTNTLATPDNLSRWGRVVDKKCALEGCNSLSTLGHILSGCNKSLDRYAYRHDSVLAHLAKTINQCKADGVEMYADLNGFRVNGGTVPADLCETQQRPDLVVILKEPRKVLLVELTICWDSQPNFQAAYDRKSTRYAQLALDIEDKGWTVSNMPLELGTRGSVDKRNSVNLEIISNLCGIRAIKRFKGALSKIALLGSYRIFLARSSNSWQAGALIEAGGGQVQNKGRSNRRSATASNLAS